MRVHTGDGPTPAPERGRPSFWRALYEEAIYHLFPWSAQFFKRRISIQAASIGLAVVVTTAWILAAAGRMGTAVVVAWWIGWSVYEIIARSYCKPWVKEGPWWRREYRPASRADLIAYVATKNLLIGAAFFLLLDVLGVLR